MKGMTNENDSLEEQKKHWGEVENFCFEKKFLFVLSMFVGWAGEGTNQDK